MGVFSGGRRGQRGQEQRYNGFVASFSNPPIYPNSASTILSQNMARAENSLQKIAMWSAVSLIAGLASELPFHVYRGIEAGTKPLPTPSYLLDIAGDGYGTPDWIYQFVVSQLLRGNAYGKIIARDTRGGFPTQVPLYHPDTVRGYRDAQGVAQWTINGKSIDDANLFHRRCWTLPGGLVGLSPVAYHASTIGLGLSAEQFGVEFFGDGGNPTGILHNTEADLSPVVAQTAKERFMAGMNGRREPVVLGRGWAWEQISIKPEESMFLKTQGYTSSEVARIFGPGMPEMLGYETGTPMTYQNDEQRNIHLLTYTLDLWFGRVERALSAFTPQPHYVKLNRDALLRTDTFTRYKTHALAIAAHIIAPSEVRDLEDMAPFTPEQLDEFQAVQPLDPILKAVTATESVK